jgi:hypothetical protein
VKLSNGERVDAYFGFAPMNQGRTRRIKWARDATGDKILTTKDIASNGPLIDAVRWDKQVRKGWKQFLDPSSKIWKKDSTHKGEVARKTFLEGIFEEKIGDPTKTGDAKEHQATTRRMKANANKDDGESMATNASSTTSLIPGTSISISTSHIQPGCYRAINNSAVVIVQRFFNGDIIATEKKAPGSKTSTLDVIESAFFNEGFCINQVDACGASNDVLDKRCSSVIESRHWTRSPWIPPRENRIVQLLTGVVDSIVEDDENQCL